jgi:phage terminase small subunit
MALTAKQSRFAELVAGGLNYSESYRRAYDAQGMSSGAIRVEGHRLARHPKIVVAVKALRQGCLKTKRQVAEASKEWVTIRLQDLADSPYSTTSQKITALEFLGKTLGMF